MPFSLTCLALLAISPAQAGTRAVDAGGGASYTSIQSAINAAWNGDTITVAAGTYSESVDTSGKQLIIVGAGSAVVTVSATGSEALTVDSGETVVLSGMTFTGGERGISVRDSVASFDDIISEGNSGASPGTGISIAEGATVSISDCIIRDNASTGGFYGGGLYASDSTVTVEQCEISGNTARQGGGVYLDGGDVAFTDVTVESNSVTTHGGGLRIRYGASLTATRVTVQDNTALMRGGGASLQDVDTTWSDSLFDNNTSGVGGGALHVDGMSRTGTVFDGTINQNTAAGSGPAAYVVDSDLTLSGDITDNVLDGAEPGGGIWIAGGTLALNSANISGHTGTNGGAVYVDSTAALTADTSVFSDNVATAAGGALFSRGPVTAVDTDFVDNTAAEGGGGWAQLDQDGSCTRCVFNRNAAGSPGGGWLQTSGMADSLGCSFLDNSASAGGGLAVVGDGTDEPRITYATFDGNTASSSGGAVSIYDVASLRMHHVTARDNVADTSGGAVYLSEIDEMNVYDMAVWDNTALVGGGILVNGGGGRLGTMRIGGNTADSGAGLALQNPDAETELYNNRFIENVGWGALVLGDSAGHVTVLQSDFVGNEGGLRLEGSGGTSVLNVIAYDNDASGISADATSVTASIGYSNAYGHTADWAGSLTGPDAGLGQISDDPKYAGYANDGDPESDTLVLATGSPCRDAGDPARVDLDGSVSDMGWLGGAYAKTSDDDEDGWTDGQGDCDDDDAAVHPDAVDTWYDGIDQDCDGSSDFDQDGDGWDGPDASGDDCDDSDPTVNPGATDVGGDGIDQDCDGSDGEGGGDGGGAGDGGGDDGGDDGGEGDGGDAIEGDGGAVSGEPSSGETGKGSGCSSVGGAGSTGAVLVLGAVMGAAGRRRRWNVG